MKKVVIPLLALLLAACVLCTGASAGDITIGSSSSSGSTVISIPEIYDGDMVFLEAFITSGRINAPVTLSVATNVSNFTMKDVTATYPEVVSSLKIGNLGIAIQNDTPYAGPFTAPLALEATISKIPESSETSIAQITGKYFNESGSFAAQGISVTVTLGSRAWVSSDIKGYVNISVAESVVATVNFIVKEDEPEPTPTQDPLRPTPTASPTSSGGSSNPPQTVKPTTVVTPTPGPTPATLPPSEKTITEVVTIPGSGIVPLTETTTLESVTFSSLNSVQKASVIATEGNTESMLLPPGVSPIQVGKVIDLSVHTEDGEKISNVKGSFIVTEKVPQGKKLIVAHGIDTANNEWRDAPVTFRGNDQHEIPFESLSPFLLILIDAGSANPLLSQPTETPTAGITAEPTTVVPTTAAPSATATKSPVPFFGLIAGLAAAGLVLSRK